MIAEAHTPSGHLLGLGEIATVLGFWRYAAVQRNHKTWRAHRRAEKHKAITGGRDFRRKAIKIRVRVRRDVEEGLGAIEPQTPNLLLNDRKGPLKVQSRATQGPVIQIPVIQQESGHLRLNPLNNRL